MSRKYLGRVILILVVTLVSFYEIFFFNFRFIPPAGRDLVREFRDRAVKRDQTFSNIVAQASELQMSRPDRTYGNLQEAIGTNDIVRYFPFFQAQHESQPTIYILNRLQREGASRIKLGLDLQGGTSFLLRMNTNELQSASVNTALSEAVEVLRRRVDKIGVAEPVIQPAGEDRILVQLPGLSQAAVESAKITIQKAAFLEFRMVHPENDELIKQGIVEPGYEILKEERKLPNGTKQITPYLVKKKPEAGLTGAYVKNAFMTRGNLGEPEIALTFNSDGALLFEQITRENTGRFMAIVLDREIYSAPRINEPISGGSARITGQFTAEQAQELANVLENPLKAPLQVIEQHQVDPTLGKDSIRSGVKAAIIGVILVAGFMLVYYMFAGMVANVALMLNIIILLGVMCMLKTTLTLPGIAGIVLTIGMAVDANVLIFERIREEAAAGKSMRGALNAGYSKAFGTIFDSNLTTLIASLILYFMGTGPVKGFGVTLTVGVCVSMFTALVVTRLIFDWLLDKDLLKRLPMLHIVRGAKIDFMRWAVPAFVASWLLIVVGNGYGIFIRGKDVLGVEFAGGDTVTLSFDKGNKVDVDKLRGAAAQTGVGDVLIAYERDIGSGSENLRVTTRAVAEKAGSSGDEAASEKVVKAFKQQFSAANFKELSVDHVGPTVGKEIQKTALLASLMAMFMILVYVAFRYEFSFAVGAVVAILHDVLMTFGWYFLAGRELNSTTVAAILTIIGFSINDTIVIFDRIREDLRLGVRGTFREVMNQALNQTFSRTIITSGTVFLATLSLYIFGGGVINDFAFTFLVGIITGTYSSIYIASALVLWWHRGERPSIGASQVKIENMATARS